MVRRRYDCPFCPSVFTRHSNRQRHIQMRHAYGPPVYPCYLCPQTFMNANLLQQHIIAHAPQNAYVRQDDLNGVATTYTRDYLQPGGAPMASLELTLGRDHPTLHDIMAYEAARKRHAKCQVVVIAEFVKVDIDLKVLRNITIYFRARTFVLTMYQDYAPLVQRAHAEVAINLEDFVYYGSGWMLYAVHRTQLQITQCNPLSGGCGEGDSQISVSCPSDVTRLRQISMYDDKMCFYRSVARHYVGCDDREALDEFVRENFKTEGFELPFRVDKIDAFERLHAATLNFRINVVYCENGSFFPAFVSTRDDAVDAERINLLLYHQRVGPLLEDNCHRLQKPTNAKKRRHSAQKDDDDEPLEKRRRVCKPLVWEELRPGGRPKEVDFSARDGDTDDDDDDDDDETNWDGYGPYGRVESHYSYISDVSRLLRKVYRGKTERKRPNARGHPSAFRKSYDRKYFCPNCLNSVSSQKLLDEHYELCRRHEAQRTMPPPKGQRVEFRKYEHRFKVPLVGYFDFEAVQIAPANRCTDTCADPTTCNHRHQPLGKQSFVVSNQEAGTYSLVILDSDDKIVRQLTYSGEDAARHFVRSLLDMEVSLQEYLNAFEPMCLTPLEELLFQLATDCHICGKPLEVDKEGEDGVWVKKRDAVRDHCHLKGYYEGAAHNECNLNRKVVKKVVLYCHNFSNYDSHLVLAAMGDDYRIRELKCLPRNQEKMRTLTMNSFEFIDSMSFLNGSLASIVGDLRDSGHDFQLLYDAGLCANAREHELLLRKGKQ